MKNKTTARIIVAAIATLLTLGLTQPAVAETMEKPASLSMAAAPTSMTSTVVEVGILSALLGIGNGVLKIPAMDAAMRLPIKVCSATRTS